MTDKPGMFRTRKAAAHGLGPVILAGVVLWIALIAAVCALLPSPAHSEGPNAADVALLLGGQPWRNGLEDVPVLLVTENPRGLLGLACDHRFEAVPGNAQALCPEGYQGIVIYPPALESVAGLLNMLRHEDYHLTEPVHEGADPFDEAGAYRAGCDYSYVDSCPWWLEHHPEVRND